MPPRPGGPGEPQDELGPDGAVRIGRADRPGPRRRGSAGRRRPGWPSLRRRPCGRSAGHAGDRRRPWRAGRRGRGNSRAAARRRSRPASLPRSRLPAGGPSRSVRNGRSRLPPPKAACRMAAASRGGRTISPDGPASDSNALEEGLDLCRGLGQPRRERAGGWHHGEPAIGRSGRGDRRGRRDRPHAGPWASIRTRPDADDGLARTLRRIVQIGLASFSYGSQPSFG